MVKNKKTDEQTRLKELKKHENKQFFSLNFVF